jgi:hypothetical protein
MNNNDNGLNKKIKVSHIHSFRLTFLGLGTIVGL